MSWKKAKRSGKLWRNLVSCSFQQHFSSWRQAKTSSREFQKSSKKYVRYGNGEETYIMSSQFAVVMMLTFDNDCIKFHSRNDETLSHGEKYHHHPRHETTSWPFEIFHYNWLVKESWVDLSKLFFLLCASTRFRRFLNKARLLLFKEFRLTSLTFSLSHLFAFALLPPPRSLLSEISLFHNNFVSDYCWEVENMFSKLKLVEMSENTL